jgi:hypothetical protein
MGTEEPSNFVTTKGMNKDKNNKTKIFFHPFNEACIKSDETNLERLNHRQHFSAGNIMPLQHGSLTGQRKETVIESVIISKSLSLSSSSTPLPPPPPPLMHRRNLKSASSKSSPFVTAGIKSITCFTELRRKMRTPTQKSWASYADRDNWFMPSRM